MSGPQEQTPTVTSTASSLEDDDIRAMIAELEYVLKLI
jgi:hypothetical protein